MSTLGCSTDEAQNSHDHLHENQLVKSIPFGELIKQSRFNNAFKKIHKKNSSLSDDIASRTIMEQDYGFTIEDTPAKVIENDSTISYTLLVGRDISTVGSFENLVLQVSKNDESIIASLLKYNLTSPMVSSAHASNSFTYNVDATPIVYNASDVNAKTGVSCFMVTVILCNNDGSGGLGPEHYAGDKCSKTYEISFEVCTGSDTGGGSGTGSGPSSPGTPNTGNNPGQHGGGGGNSGGGTVVTSPVMPTKREIWNMFTAPTSITQGENQWLSSHPSVANALKDYLGANWSLESHNFAQQFVKNSLESGFNLDFEQSLKSPANIDLSSLDDSTPEKKKIKCIYKTLTTSSAFKNLIINTFDTNDRLNIKLEVGELPNTTNGKCTMQATTVNGVTTINNVILINKNILNNSKSDIYIARVILHECIHAYLNIKRFNCNNGATLPYLNNLQLQELIGTFYQSFNCHITVGGTEQSQHDFIFNHMTPTFVSILNEVKNQLISPAHQAQVQSFTSYDSTAQVLVPFNWNDLFYNMSLSGLHETESFQQQIQSDTQKLEKYVFYTNLSAQLTKNCN